jgi:hypothetical protein
MASLETSATTSRARSLAASPVVEGPAQDIERVPIVIITTAIERRERARRQWLDSMVTSSSDTRAIPP